MATTATRNKKTGKVEVDEAPAPVQTNGAEKRQRNYHPVPEIGETVKISDLDFKANSKSNKYLEIVDAIRSLKLTKPRQGVTFTPAEGETAEQCKMRIQALVSRSCAKAAPEGTRYRTRVTVDDHVCVFLDEKPKDG